MSMRIADDSPERDGLEIKIKTPGFRDCEHLSILLDDELRRVTCKECGERLDPYQVIRKVYLWAQKVKSQHRIVEEFQKKERERSKRAMEQRAKKGKVMQ